MPQAQKDDLLVDGDRVDGRAPDEMRAVEMDVGPLNRPDGSAFVEIGDTRIMAAVEGPKELHPQHLQKADRALLQAKYNMAPFSVDDRMSPKPSRRSKEISMVTRDALVPAVKLEQFPKAAIKLHIEVLEADASTRVTGITAAGLALADAGIPMDGIVQACAVGKLEDQMVLDVAGEEDAYGKADIPVATINGNIDKTTLLQMDGDITAQDLSEGLDLAEKGNQKLHELQKQALKESFNAVGGE